MCKKTELPNSELMKYKAIMKYCLTNESHQHGVSRQQIAVFALMCHNEIMIPKRSELGGIT